ncbi:uncharacterized protein LOC134836024 [Culicoides brevitarsis]|uniref:uncharacterized protein LOC134836024 n=1 Tax=Culicoides brevitarsis TaxID=469753 RepID=UPI00307BAF3C
MTKVPDFLTNEYLEKALRKYEKCDNLKVLEFKCKPAVAAGNNYASLLLRASVKLSKNNNEEVEKSIIIKTVVPDPEIAKSIEDFGIYKREILMYDQILPKYHALLESMGDDEKLYSPAIAVDPENSTLIFEDLKKRGFSLASRLKGVDETHLNLVTRKIAKFHACSMVLHERDESSFNQFRDPPFVANAEAISYFDGMSEALLEQMRTWQGYEYYVKKFEKLKKWLPSEVMNVYSESKIPISVLTHGDLWVNNMMFKYDEKMKPLELLLIDFQIGYFGTPVTDVLYFTLTSTIDDIKFTKFPEILQKYHGILVSCLKQLDFKGKLPTLFELYNQFVEKSFFELYTVVSVLPIIINKEEENADVSYLMTDTPEAQKFKKEMFANERLIATVKHFLPLWDKVGLLDPLH